jgi:hypothetical protein
MVKLSDDVDFRIKWLGPNTPYIEFGDVRIYLSKADVKKVRKELNDFITFYSESFTKENINKTDYENEDD